MRTQFFSSAFVALLCATASVARLQPGVYRIRAWLPDGMDDGGGLCTSDDPAAPENLVIRDCDQKLQEWAVDTTPDGFYTIRKPGPYDGNCGQNECVRTKGWHWGEPILLGNPAGNWDIITAGSSQQYYIRSVEAEDPDLVWTTEQVQNRLDIVLSPSNGARGNDSQQFVFSAVAA